MGIMPRGEEILISLEPRHAENILSGEKTAELRTRKMNLAPKTRVWLYAKMPVGAVVGFVFVEKIVSGPPRELWKLIGHKSKVSMEEFSNYFERSAEGHALFLRSPVRLRTTVPLASLRSSNPQFSPPQFFKRLDKSRDSILSLLEDSIRQ